MKPDWTKIYSIIEEFLQSEDYHRVADLCLSASEQDPKQARCWYLRSKAMQGLNDHEQAKHDILVALDLEPLNLDYFFQLCMVLIQSNEGDEIAPRINRLWPHVPETDRDKFLGFVSASVDSMFSKFELTNELLGHVLRYRNKSGD